MLSVEVTTYAVVRSCERLEDMWEPVFELLVGLPRVVIVLAVYRDHRERVSSTLRVEGNPYRGEESCFGGGLNQNWRRAKATKGLRIRSSRKSTKLS